MGHDPVLGYSLKTKTKTRKESNMTKLGDYRVRQVARMFVVEQFRWSGWHIIESLSSWDQAERAARDYHCPIV
jgi:hypothetical protein